MDIDNIAELKEMIDSNEQDLLELQELEDEEQSNHKPRNLIRKRDMEDLEDDTVKLYEQLHKLQKQKPKKAPKPRPATYKKKELSDLEKKISDLNKSKQKLVVKLLGLKPLLKDREFKDEKKQARYIKRQKKYKPIIENIKKKINTININVAKLLKRINKIVTKPIKISRKQYLSEVAKIKKKYKLKTQKEASALYKKLKSIPLSNRPSPMRISKMTSVQLKNIIKIIKTLKLDAYSSTMLVRIIELYRLYSKHKDARDMIAEAMNIYGNIYKPNEGNDADIAGIGFKN